MNIAIIPARQGSKRIPAKNIRMFNGAPIISYPIRAAQKSKLFDEIIVSTDSPLIQEVSNEHGAITPFVRPDDLSGDHVGTMEVIQHALDYVVANICSPEYVCCIYPTAALLSEKDLVESLEQLKVTNKSYVVPVCGFEHPIEKALVEVDGAIELKFPKKRSSRTQDLEASFRDAGQFYWGKSKAWLSKDEVFGKESSIFKLPRYRAIDIDVEEDWKLAEIMHKYLYG